MLILAIDTSWKHGGLALARGDGRQFELLEATPLAGGTFSAQLVPQLAGMLARHGLGKQDLDGFAAASGPGSFTGLRVGLAAIKGLAEVLKKPIAVVSVLEALAAESGLAGHVTAVLDAGRGEVYVGEYDVEADGTVPQGESLLTLAEFLAGLDSQARVVTPEEKIAQGAQERGASAQVTGRPGAGAVARIGLRRLLAGQTVSTEALDANYLRRSDAEIFSKSRP